MTLRFFRLSFRRGACAGGVLVASLFATAAHAAMIPFATFDRLLWSPDGSTLALQATLVDLEYSTTSPVRVDTLLVDPIGGRVTCVTPHVDAFALNAARDSLFFADAYGAYILPLDGTRTVREVLWRPPASDMFVRRLAFSKGEYVINTGCITDLSPGCNEEWGIPYTADRLSLADARALQTEGHGRRARIGVEAEYARYQMHMHVQTPIDAPTRRAAFLRTVMRSAGLSVAGTAPRMDIRYAHELSAGGQWILAVALRRTHPWLSRAYTCLYTPATRAVKIVAEDALIGCAPLGAGGFYYNNSDGVLWRIVLGPRSMSRTRILTSFVPPWAATLGPPGVIAEARAIDLPTVTRADELAASLITDGYHAWPIPSSGGKWGVAVGWYGSKAEADTVAAQLAAEGYATDVRTVEAPEVRGTVGSRGARYLRVPAPKGPLEGSEAILEVVAIPDIVACTLYLREKGREPHEILNGYNDVAPVRTVPSAQPSDVPR
jgi:hypothetical protein